MRTLNFTNRHWSRFTRSALFVLAMIIMVGVASGGALYASADPNSSPNTPTTKPSNQQTSQPPAVPLTNLQYGFTMALLQNNTVVRSMGFQWVSYTIGWDTAEPTQGNFNWGDADNIANYARNAGVNVLIRVSRSPQWARNANCTSNPTCPPSDARFFGDFMGALAAHVRPLISPQRVAYEVWNEPNTEYEWGGLCPDPEFYTAMLRAVYPRVKANDPSATVAAG